MLLGAPAVQVAARSQPDGLCHYLEALDFQREIVKIHAVFGVKTRIQTGLSAGCLAPLTLTKRRGRGGQYGTPEPGAVDYPRTADFINNVMIPDALAIGQSTNRGAKSARVFLINVSSATRIPGYCQRLW